MESIIESTKPPLVSNPRKPSLSSSFSFAIRAPLTLDDDDSGSDYEPNDNKFRNTTSSEDDSGSEFEKTTSERPLVGAKEEDGEVVYRSFVVARSYDNKSLESGGSDGESENPKFVRPIAKLSWDDEDDEIGSENSDDFVDGEGEYGEKIRVKVSFGVKEEGKKGVEIEEEKSFDITSVDEVEKEDKNKFEDFNVVSEYSNDLELLKEEKDVVEDIGKGLVEGKEVSLLESKYAVEDEESVVCQGRDDKSLDKDNSLVDAVEFHGTEVDSSVFSVSNQAEEIVVMSKFDFSEIIEVDGCENALSSDSSLDQSVKLVADVEEEEAENSFVYDEDAEDGEIEQSLAAEVETGSEGKGEGLFDSATFLSILDAATGVDDSTGKLALQQTANASELGVEDEFEDNLSDEEKKKIEKMRVLRVKYLRLVHRLGISLEDSTVNEVLDGLIFAYGEHHGYVGALESAKRMALDLEANKETDLDFCLNILVLGKSGVGKSATINLIFGEKKAAIHAFEPATSSLREIVVTIDGVKIKILDTPGLKVPATEQAINQKILAAISKFMKKCPPDVVLYVDRLDTETGDNDLPMLKSITRSLGSSIWQKTIVTLTHSASSPPDGPLGLPLSHNVFVARKSRLVLQSISTAVGNKHLLNPSFMCPVSLVENSPLSCQDSLGRSQLLLLCYSGKVLSEASSLSPPQNSSDWKRVLGYPIRSLALSYLLSSLFQSHPHTKLGNNADSFIEYGGLGRFQSEEDEDEYENLPPFRPLSKSQVAELNKEQRKAYFEEYDHWVKLFERKQWREAVKRLKEIKNKENDGVNAGHDIGVDGDEEGGNLNQGSELVPPSFDGNDHAYRYRSSALVSKLLVGRVLETPCWDHDCGWDGVSLESDFAVAGRRIPATFRVQISKDKSELNLHLDSSLSLKHGERGSSLARLDVETFGTRLGYILRGETKPRSFKMNKTTAGVTVTLVGENVAAGLKIQDQIAIGQRLVLSAGAGGVQSDGDAAYGANFEVRLKEKEFIVGQEDLELSSLGLSLMKWRGDLALTAAVQSRFTIGRSSKMAVRFGLNNERRGQISIRTSGSDQLQMALAGILPILVSVIGSIFSGFGAQN